MAITPYTGTFPNRISAGDNEAYATDVYNYLNYIDGIFVTTANSTEANINAKEVSVTDKEAIVVAKEALMNPHYTAIDAVYANEADITAVATDIIPNLPEILQAETNAATASAAATIAIAAVNYKGDWVSGYETTGYSIGMSVSYTDGYNYTSKINNNLVEPTTKTNTTEWNWIEAIDPSTVYTKSEADTLLSAKVNTSDLTELTQDVIGSSVVAGNNIAVSYNDTTGLTEVAFSGAIAGGFTNMQVFNTSGTFNIASAKGAGVYFIEVVGGGGAGGSCVAAAYKKTSSGAGGGGVRGFVNIASNVAVTIGAGGVPFSGSNGGKGGTTTFGSYATANGGYGGYMADNYTVPTGGTASAVGMISYKTYSGQDGGLPYPASTVNMVAGGGSSPFIIANTNVQAVLSTMYIYGKDGRESSGCGGSGCATSDSGLSPSIGGRGGSGYVIVYW